MLETFENMDNAKILTLHRKYGTKYLILQRFASKILSGKYDLTGADVHYTKGFSPSLLARQSLLYLQNLASCTYPSTHFTMRNGLHSYLLSATFYGSGHLSYNGASYDLSPMPQLYSALLIGNSIVLHFDENSAFLDNLNRLFDINQNENSGNEFMSNCLLTQLLSEFLMRTTVSIADKGDFPTWFVELCEYYNEKLTLDGLSARFYIGKYYMCRELKRLSSDTITGYQTNARINAAKDLLRYTDKPLWDIAALIGFNYLSYFNTSVRKVEALTPSNYRKQWRGL